jgi:hypothetical protein
MRRRILGATAGFVFGLLALVLVLKLAVWCLPFLISGQIVARPAVCTDPVYSVLIYLAFPVNLITHDLTEAMLLSPLSLLFYTLVGALTAPVFKRR